MLRACSFWCSIAIFWKHQTVLSETTTEKTHTQTQVSNSLSFEYIHEPNGRWFVIYSMRFHIDCVQHNIAHEKNFKWLLLKMGVRQFKHLTKWMWQFCCDFEFNRDRIGDDLIVCYCSLQAYRNINWFHNITRRSFVWFTWLKVCTTGWQQKENDIYSFYRHFVLSKTQDMLNISATIKATAIAESHILHWNWGLTLNFKSIPSSIRYHHHQLKTVYILEIDSIWLKSPWILPFFYLSFCIVWRTKNAKKNTDILNEQDFPHVYFCAMIIFDWLFSKHII